MSSQEHKLKMKIKPDLFFAGSLNSPSLKRLLAHTDLIVSPRDINFMLHKAHDATPDVDISIIRKSDLISMLREVEDHRGIAIYRNADIDVGSMSHSTLRNYQTFVSLQKIGGISQLNAFFTEHGFSGGLAAESEALLIRATIKNRAYAAFYVPPIIEYQAKGKILIPLRRLEQRAKETPIIQLPGYDMNGSLSLQPVIDDWNSILSRSQTTVPVLKDGTHRSYTANMVGVPVTAIIINQSDSLMQSVPLRTDMLVLTNGKPKDRSDRMLGLLKIGEDQWEGWVDLARVGIDG